MKLVVTFNVGDGYTYSCLCTIPIEYESGEALLVDLEDHCKRYLLGQEDGFNNGFKGTYIFANDLIEHGKYYAPIVRTLEEWWEQEAVNVSASLR